MDEQMNRHTGGLMDNRLINKWMKEWIDGWMTGIIDGWMDGWNYWQMDR